MNIIDAEKAYKNDPAFRRIVDTIKHGLYEMAYSPCEVRAAAMLACIHFENERPRPNFIRQTDLY